MSLIPLLSKETLERIILESYQVLQPEACTASIKGIEQLKELKSALYHYLKAYTASSELAKAAVSVLSPVDIQQLQHLHSYNYHKLKITLKTNGKEI